MAGLIQRLPAALANQIAAGEVVERPASAIKELIENALDAGASRVEVSIEQGGLASFAVADDGRGMSAEDAPMALERHATSKLRAFDDLSAIGTFGFRGEALPSIASVTRFKLQTRARGAAQGTQVTVDEHGESHSTPIGCAEGTRVEATELFYNVPARRKFLKSVATEAAHVSDVVRSAALARPDVTFVLRRDGKVSREYLRDDSREARARALAQGEPLIAVGFSRGPLHVEAYLAPPERARAGTAHLDVMVNDRPVRDLRLARAVAQAYGALLEAGRYPYGVVYLDLPPADVDVNVHPQKAEVRFVDSRAVYEALRFALERELLGAFQNQKARPGIGSFPLHPGAPRGAGKLAEPSLPFSQSARGAAPQKPLPESVQATLTPPSYVAWNQAKPAPQATLDPRFVRPAPPQKALHQPSLAGLDLDAVRAPQPTPGEPQPVPAAPDPLPEEPSLFRSVRFYGGLRAVGTLHAQYILCEGSDGLYVLDRHAVYERGLLHRLRELGAHGALPSAPLPVPKPLSLSAAELTLIAAQQPLLEALGFELRELGAQRAAVHALAAALDPRQAEPVVQAVLRVLRTLPRDAEPTAPELLAALACHGAPPTDGDAPSLSALADAVAQLDEVDFSQPCLHGQAVVFRMGSDELERRRPR